MSAYIPTNLISITDGQLYLSPTLFHRGIVPAIEINRSVSRVGGKAQISAFHTISGELQLAYAQFEELENFSRFSTRLDEQTIKSLERGRRVREVLNQAQYSPLSVPEQIAVLLSVSNGLLDSVSLSDIPAAEEAIQRAVVEQLPDICQSIVNGEPFTAEQQSSVLDISRHAIENFG